MRRLRNNHTDCTGSVNCPAKTKTRKRSSLYMMQKYTPEAELALNKYCFETMSLAASLRKEAILPICVLASASGSLVELYLETFR